MNRNKFQSSPESSTTADRLAPERVDPERLAPERVDPERLAQGVGGRLAQGGGRLAPGGGGRLPHGVVQLPPGAVRLPFGVVRLRARLEAMRANGMSETAVRRALHLSEAEAVAHGVIAPVQDLDRGAGPGGGAGACAGAGAGGGAGAKGPAIAARADRRGDPPCAEPSPDVPAPVRVARGPGMVEVLEAVARASGFGAPDLLSPGQARDLARARQLVMYLLRGLCAGASLPAIACFLQRDHTTVLYGCRRAKALLQGDPRFQALHARARRVLDAPSVDVPMADGPAADEPAAR
jgi:hypothetical protein